MGTAAASLISNSDDFIQKASNVWKLIKDVKKAYEPISKVDDAFDMANRALSGRLPAYSAGVEKARDYIANEKDVLSKLARKDENYWMDRSGANLFSPAAMLEARTNLDQWILNFSQLRTLVQQFIPVAQSMQKMLSNRAVVGIRGGLAESDLPALDGMVMEDIVGDLGNSEYSLGIILDRLRNCRRVLHY